MFGKIKGIQRIVQQLSKYEALASRQAAQGLLELHGQSHLQQPWAFTTALARWYSVAVQETPNPASLMFVPGKTILKSGTYDFSDARQASSVSPLAETLFTIPGVQRVFFSKEFVTITKGDDVNWPDLIAQVKSTLEEFLASEQQVLKEGAASNLDQSSEQDDETVAMIKELLDTQVRPQVQDDGGDVLFHTFDPETGTLVLKLQGACSGCPSSSVTLKNGIEQMMMHYIEDVKRVVEADPDEVELESNKQFEKLEEKLKKKQLEKHLST